MSMYKSMQETFIQEYKERSPEYKARIVAWSAQPPVVRVEKPTNITRARELGYKAKEGILVARVRVLGGTKKRPMFSGGRKPSKSGRYLSRQKSTQSIAEERAGRRFTNCEVLNSYFVGEAGSSKFYEVILLDRASPSLANDPQYSRVITQRDRAARGLTHSGRKHRGISQGGYGTVKNRPSVRGGFRKMIH